MAPVLRGGAYIVFAVWRSVGAISVFPHLVMLSVITPVIKNGQSWGTNCKRAPAIHTQASNRTNSCTAFSEVCIPAQDVWNDAVKRNQLWFASLQFQMTLKLLGDESEAHTSRLAIEAKWPPLLWHNFSESLQELVDSSAKHQPQEFPECSPVHPRGQSTQKST